MTDPIPTIPSSPPAITEAILPISGKKATLRRPTGRDMVEAEMLCGGVSRPLAIQMALLSRCAIIDGRTLPYEDFLDMDAEDLDILGKLDMVSVVSQAATSSPSQESPAGPGRT